MIPVGGSFSEPAMRAMGWGGRFIVIGFAAGWSKSENGYSFSSAKSSFVERTTDHWLLLGRVENAYRGWTEYS